MKTVQEAVVAARDHFGIPQQLPEKLPATIIDLLADAFAENADAPAFSALGGTLTYRRLNELSDHFAAFLQHQAELRPGDRIAIQLPNLLQYPVVAFAAFKAGLVVVNTNPLYTVRELSLQLRDSGARAVVVLDSLLHNTLKALPDTDVQLVIATGAADLLAGARRVLLQAAIRLSGKGRKAKLQENEIGLRKALDIGRQQRVELATPAPGDIALLQYTGGTTGISKGAELSHENLVANTMQTLVTLEKAGIDRGGEVVIAPLPLYHVFSFVVSMVMMVHIHGHVHLIPDPRNINSMVKVLRSTSFSIFFGLNTLFAALLRHDRFSSLDFSSLRLTAAGGMALSESVAQDWQRVTGCPITEGYGLTETSPVVAVNVPGQELLGTVGVAVPATEVRVADSDGAAQPLGEAGELWVRGPQVMRGYWRNKEETANSLLDEGWFRTGDVACVEEDGRIRILDRQKDMILVSGFNVYPNEVENVFSSHPGILECAAIGVPDADSGEAVKLFVVSSDGELDGEALRQWSREYLTGYKVPSHFEFRDELPKSNVGKVLRAKLRG